MLFDGVLRDFQQFDRDCNTGIKVKIIEKKLLMNYNIAKTSLFWANFGTKANTRQFCFYHQHIFSPLIKTLNDTFFLWQDSHDFDLCILFTGFGYEHEY